MNNLCLATEIPRSFAFFDVDDTLISVNSMLGFQALWFERMGNEGREAYEKDLQALKRPDASWQDLNRRYYQYFAGRKVAQVKACGEAWFEVQMAKGNFYHPAILQELRQHQDQGREVVFVSGSFPALLRPIARYLGVCHILATSMEICGDSYTGRIIAPQTIGEGKALAIREFLEVMEVDAQDCYAYGDDISDLPMLQSVGNPRVVSGGRRLEEHARRVGWQVIAPR